MSADDAERRIRELEEQLKRAKQEAAWHKATIREWLLPLIPDDPPTEEEMRRLVADTDGTPILDIIAEFERGGA